MTKVSNLELENSLREATLKTIPWKEQLKVNESGRSLVRCAREILLLNGTS